MYYLRKRSVWKNSFFIIFLLLLVNTRAQHDVISLSGNMPDMYDRNNATQLYREITHIMAYSKNNQDSAIQFIEQRVSESIMKGYYEAVFQGSFYLGVLYIYRGDYDMAHEWLWRALVYSEKSTNVFVSMTRTLNNIGNVFQFRGDYRQALEYYFKAIAFAENGQTSESRLINPLIRLYTSTAASLMQIREYPRALYYLDKAEELAEKTDHINNLPAVYIHKGMLYRYTGDLDQAWSYSQQASSLAVKFQMEEVQFMVLQNLGDILLQRANIDEAIDHFNRALQVRGNVNPYYRAGVYISLGKLYFLKEHYDEAEVYYKKALEIASGVKIPDHMLSLHNYLSELYMATGRYALALKHRNAAYALNDSLLNKDKMQALNLLEVKYRVAESRKDVVQKQSLINEQKRKLAQQNMWIVVGGAIVVVLIVLLLGFYRNYRQRQKLYAQQLYSMQQEKEIELLHAMMQGEEKERVRFAHELHDGISSQLSAIKLCVDVAREKYDLHPVGNDLDQIMQMLGETSADVRKSAHNLMPDGLIQQGLEDATRKFCSLVTKGDSLQIEVQVYGDMGGLDDTLALSVYRIVQELIHNVVKHARATQAIVLFNRMDEKVCITVEDNGIGIDCPASDDGVGLKSLHDRVQVLSGKLIVESASGKGTTIYMELPVVPLHAV